MHSRISQKVHSPLHLLFLMIIRGWLYIISLFPHISSVFFQIYHQSFYIFVSLFWNKDLFPQKNKDLFLSGIKIFFFFQIYHQSFYNFVSLFWNKDLSPQKNKDLFLSGIKIFLFFQIYHQSFSKYIITLFTSFFGGGLWHVGWKVTYIS